MVERETRIRWHNLGTTSKQVMMVWACGAKRRQWLGEVIHSVWSGRCQAKENLRVVVVVVISITGFSYDIVILCCCFNVYSYTDVQTLLLIEIVYRSRLCDATTSSLIFFSAVYFFVNSTGSCQAKRWSCGGAELVHVHPVWHEQAWGMAKLLFVQPRYFIIHLLLRSSDASPLTA